ncbi:MAG: phosphoglycerate kinase [Bacteroidetes bacterium]|nr:phosphoglycerate kinase [Bacteroidota bacterium]MBK9415471.1 phosphoglycerate kinase [Bacteroidota bacterium]MBP6427313.1 phosphoglycerate kinase [Bacteroidia bacterium]MBP6656531.1 phosphoglycerate kinase [Bacteroidia bacterium]
MKTIDHHNFKNEKALIRVDFNVPLDKEYNITDNTRIRASIPTIKKILSDGGSVILMSHLGRPKEGPVEKYSLKHLVDHIAKLLDTNVKFAEDCIGEQAKQLAAGLKPGEVLLLENLRFYKEEEKGDSAFAKKLAALGDVYVNDAFGTAHRAHASTAVIAENFPGKKFFGYVMANEIANADKVLLNSEKPFTAIMGGAKVSDKILIIEQLMNRVDNLLIGGGMAFTFVKAMGGTIGSSLVEEDKLDLALSIIEKAKAKNVNLILPVDAIIADKFDANANSKECNINEIPDGWMGLDIGPKSEKLFNDAIAQSKTILWNGPAGVFEFEKFSHGTKSVAKAIAAATANGAFSLIGGGDSAAAISKFNLTDRVSYVSTGGGALLEYIEGKELPGVVAIGK